MLGSVLIVYCPCMLPVVLKDFRNASINIAMSLAALLVGVCLAFRVGLSMLLEGMVL